jgi:hypothetical protein
MFEEIIYNHSIPSRFSKFTHIIDHLYFYSPAGIAIVGSYGDFTKAPTINSDLDLIFVYDSDCILSILEYFLNMLSANSEVQFNYLGVHYQFGHLISMHYKKDPYVWVDIGIMDVNYASNYLVDLPIKVIQGNIKTSGISTSPVNQLYNLAKKILKAKLQKHDQQLLIFCNRYLGWWKVLFDTAARYSNNSSIDLFSGNGGIQYSSNKDTDIRRYFLNYNSIKESDELIKIVIADIKKNFPLLF